MSDYVESEFEESDSDDEYNPCIECDFQDDFESHTTCEILGYIIIDKTYKEYNFRYGFPYVFKGVTPYKKQGMQHW